MIIYIYPCKTKYYIIIIVVFDVELQMSEFENKNGGCKEVFKKLKKVCTQKAKVCTQKNKRFHHGLKLSLM